MGVLEKRAAVRFTDDEMRMIEELEQTWYPDVPRPQGVVIRRAIREAYERMRKKQENNQWVR